LGAHCHRQGSTQHFLGQRRDGWWERRRKQQCLTLLGKVGQDPPQVRQEAHIEHAIGLIEHEHLQVSQPGGVLRQVIEQPAGRRGHDIHMFTQGLRLACAPRLMQSWIA
jgi:hypothetical protein